MTSRTSSNQSKPLDTASDAAMKAITYSMDALVPGFYLWLGPIKLRLGGCKAEEGYSGIIHSPAGVALVLPGYHIFTTYQGSYDPS